MVGKKEKEERKKKQIIQYFPVRKIYKVFTAIMRLNFQRPASMVLYNKRNIHHNIESYISSRTRTISYTLRTILEPGYILIINHVYGILS